MKISQEEFWMGSFGDEYVKRNLTFSRVAQFSMILSKNNCKLQSILELGANVGNNLDSIKVIYSNVETTGIEINQKACKILRKKHQCFNKSIVDFNTNKKFDLVFTYGVLIHINPKFLKKIYSKMYKFSSKYILLSEYYNPTPIEVLYRDNQDKLFKRDFAKELWTQYPSLELVDYGFFWKYDPIKPDDDWTWFLFKKQSKLK